MPARPARPTGVAADASVTDPATVNPADDTRTRLVQTMSRALQQRGYHGIGLAELLASAGAPKGVLYHHFPGGKQALAVAAIDATAAHIHRSLDRLTEEQAPPLPVLAGWLQMAQAQLERSDYERGCPLATVALESTAADVALRDALARAFDGIRTRLARLLQRAGVSEGRAIGLAALVVSSYEGALIQARVARSGAPMAAAAETLLALLKHELPAAAARPDPKATP
ncbi:MAG: TetR family transcriptional regulator C-terminal domain-containing protein [Burkholderiaceae bacterium]|nr:TetR family transcriptional regulator C-terminal domain-containing protein [Burkholderiaceae bacterium]